MAEFKNVLQLAADALLYFVVLASLLRARTRIGLGAFFCALGVMHCPRNVSRQNSVRVAAIRHRDLAGIDRTVYRQADDAALALYSRGRSRRRQPIYGLLFGNVLLFALAYLMRLYTPIALTPGRVADFTFLNEMGALMVWGTAILFFDCIIMILLYERSRGIASCSRDATNYDKLFEIADKRLYEAKAAGRNRVIGAGKSVRLVQAG